jgi:hypothetical protein
MSPTSQLELDVVRCSSSYLFFSLSTIQTKVFSGTSESQPIRSAASPSRDEITCIIVVPTTERRYGMALNAGILIMAISGSATNIILCAVVMSPAIVIEVENTVSPLGGG